MGVLPASGAVNAAPKLCRTSGRAQSAAYEVAVSRAQRQGARQGNAHRYFKKSRSCALCRVSDSGSATARRGRDCAFHPRVAM